MLLPAVVMLILTGAIVAISIAATTSSVSTFWFIPGDIMLMCNLCTLIFMNIYMRVFGHHDQDQNNHDESRWDGDEDIEKGTVVYSSKITIPHPRDPRLRDNCLFCLEPLQRDYISTRLAILDDGAIAFDFCQETLIRPCKCGYSLHASCALECLAKSNKCIVCKQPIV